MQGYELTFLEHLLEHLPGFLQSYVLQIIVLICNVIQQCIMT